MAKDKGFQPLRRSFQLLRSIELEPQEGIFRIRALAFLAYELKNYEHQRSLSKDRVQEIKEEQSKYDVIFFATPLVVFHLHGEYFLGDGQHRRQALLELNTEGADLSEVVLDVRVWVCGTNQALARRIYKQCNSNYAPNSSIDPDTGRILEKSDVAQEVHDFLVSHFKGQVGKDRAPQFDSNCLLAKLRACHQIYTASKAIELILEANTRTGQILKDKYPAKYGRCTSGFYLPYDAQPRGSPGCKWVDRILCPK